MILLETICQDYSCVALDSGEYMADNEGDNNHVVVVVVVVLLKMDHSAVEAVGTLLL